MSQTVSADELLKYAGKTLRVSDWVQITQDQIDRFADVTNDHQFIHVEPEKAAASRFESTIAHGFLTLSLISNLEPRDWPALENTEMVINYGLDKLRFLRPVKVESRVRLRTKIVSVTEKRPHEYLVHTRRTMEIEGVDKPAFVAVQLVLIVQKQ